MRIVFASADRKGISRADVTGLIVPNFVPTSNRLIARPSAFIIASIMRIESFKGKPVLIKIRDKQTQGALTDVEPNGVWITGARDLVAVTGSHSNATLFFVPWTSIDWIAAAQ